MSKAMAFRRISAVSVTAAMAAAVLAVPAASDQPDPLPLGRADLPIRGVTDAAQPRSAGQGQRQAYLLKLSVRSTSRTYTAAGEGADGRRAARQQLDRVSAAQRAVIAELPPKTPVLYRTHALLSGVAVTTDPSNVDELQAIRGVSQVYPIAPKSPSLTSSIPLQGGPVAWQASGTGKDVSIAIIDTGIDYTHADFGGPGTVQAFEDAQAIDDDTWPNARVVGGYDLVGDAYDADLDTPPVPDPNPLDCNGHGTHVAGIAAGQGVNSDGTPFTGPYDENTDVNALKIGPGMAPEANLYAFRVFGCEGTTNVVSEALDRAVDPDQNGDPSDHVDVVNMSLGADFGSALDADSIATNAAVEAGVVVVASAGNGGDLTDVSGSPGNASKAVSVANSADARSILDGTNLLINGAPGQIGSTRAARYLKWDTDDLAGDVVLAPADNVTACAPFTDAQKPDLVGKVVLVKWTQEALECGSAQRGANLRAAGAIGFILANSAETFDAGISGDTVIPGVLVVKSGGDAIRNALVASQPVSVLGTEANAVRQDTPDMTDTVSVSSSRGIHTAGNLKPDISAVGDTVFSAAVGSGTEGLSETGTSMAAPTVAGLAALVLQANNGWTPAQVKATMMNTASDLTTGGNGTGATYAPVRVGAGRIQADQAVASDVTAAVTGDPGAVSVSFGPVEVGGPMTRSKTVAVTNHGATAVDYDVSYAEITGVRGVRFTVSPETLNVAAGATENVTVTFEAESRQALDNTVDPTIGRVSNRGTWRTTLAEASGRVVLTPTTGPELRVPVYAAPRPVSSLTGGAAVNVDPVSQKGQVTMSGPGLGFGANGTFDYDPDNDITSIGAAFELAATDPQARQCESAVDVVCWTLPIERAADIRQVGVMTSGDMAYFAIVADKPWNTPDPVTGFDVYLDTDGDGIEDYIARTSRLRDTDTMVVSLTDLDLDEIIDVEYVNGLPGNIDTALYDSDTLLMPVWLPALAGVDPSDPRINYAVMGMSAYQVAPVDLVGFTEDGDLGLSVDVFNPGLRTVDGNGQSVYPETNGTVLNVTRDKKVYEANKSQGLLLIHLHNAVGAKSEVLAVSNGAGATTTTLAADAGSVQVGNPVGLTVSVSGVSGTPTGQVQVVAAETSAVLAEGALGADGKVALTYTPTTVGTVKMVARYLGDPANQSSTSPQVQLTVTATPPPAVEKQKQTLAAALPRRIKRSGLTLITPANARTNAGQLVRTQVRGQSRAAGETRLYTVVRGRNGKVSLRTYGHKDLRFVITQKAPATQAYLPLQRRAVYVDGPRRR